MMGDTSGLPRLLSGDRAEITLSNRHVIRGCVVDHDDTADGVPITVDMETDDGEAWTLVWTSIIGFTLGTPSEPSPT